MRRIAVLALAALLGAGCAAPPQPVLFPNAQLERVGRARAQREIDECLALAARDVGDTREHAAEGAARRTAEHTAIGAATGAAVWAALGRNAARGAAGGAAGAATHTAARAILHPERGAGPDPLFRGYVERCLHQRGYDVIGWRSPG